MEQKAVMAIGARPFFGSWLRERIVGFTFVALVYLLYFPLTAYSVQLTPVDITTTFDRSVPLQPFWIVIYAMIYPAALLPIFVIKDPLIFRGVVKAYVAVEVVAIVIFLVIPVHMNLRPPIETLQDDSFLWWGMRLCYWADHPTCCFPSLHVATATVSALGCLRVDQTVGRWAVFVAFLISLSTMLVKQHFLYDVIAGGGIACLFHFLWVHQTKALDESQRAHSRWWLSIPIVFFAVLMTVFYVLYRSGWQPWDG